LHVHAHRVEFFNAQIAKNAELTLLRAQRALRFLAYLSGSPGVSKEIAAMAQLQPFLRMPAI